MSNIDHSQIVTKEMKQANQRTALQDAAKAECRRRIEVVVDRVTQLNLASALLTHNAVTLRNGSAEEVRAASGLSDEDIVTVLGMRGWIADMQDATAVAAADPTTSPEADTHWPAPPEGLAALAARF